MVNVFDALFSSNGFIPHGHCYLWKPGLVWLHILSNALIALAYFSIPLTLIYFVRKRRDVPFHQVFLLFGAFIVSCGAGHLMDIWTLWHPVYWLSGVLKAITALISVYTALALIPLIPQALLLPSPAQMEQANQELQQALVELQQTQAQLIQAEKMSTLGQLVAGIAHEINNPINFIHGNLNHVSAYANELLQLIHLYQAAHPTPDSALKQAIADHDLEFIETDFPKMLASMKVGADRIRQIVLSLRNFSRLDEADVKPVNIHEGLESTLLILQHQLKPVAGRAAVAVHKNYGELPLIECFAGQLNQVFMNLLSNAIDALENRRQRLVTQQINPEDGTSCALEPAAICITTRLSSAKQVEIAISDNGCGMSEAVQNQLFSPFFTTKPAGKGTGLGLSISRQIVVEKHRGQLECISQTGQGTTFLIKIPVKQVVSEPCLKILPESILPTANLPV